MRSENVNIDVEMYGYFPTRNKSVT